MGVLQTDCPHCGSAGVGMHTFGILHLRPETAPIVNAVHEFLAAAACPLCSEPVCAHLRVRQYPGNQNMLLELCSEFSEGAENPG